MYFLILATDAPDSSELRKSTRPVHREYLRNPTGHDIKVHLGGPTLEDNSKEMNGTLLVVQAQSVQCVEDFVADDPYSKAGLFSSVTIRPWVWSLGNTVGAVS